MLNSATVYIHLHVSMLNSATLFMPMVTGSSTWIRFQRRHYSRRINGLEKWLRSSHDPDMASVLALLVSSAVHAVTNDDASWGLVSDFLCINLILCTVCCDNVVWTFDTVSSTHSLAPDSYDCRCLALLHRNWRHLLARFRSPISRLVHRLPLERHPGVAIPF